MKDVFKFILGMLLGACIGFILVGLCIVLFTDLTLIEFLSRLSNVDLLEIAEASALAVVCFALAVFLQIILHEGGHLIFGLASGYKFVSFRILSLTLIRENGHFRIKRFNIVGTGGQCLLSPPDVPHEQIPYFWYNVGGVLMNFLIAIAALVIWILTDIYFLNILLLFLFVSGFFLGLLNGIPMKVGGITNDAYNLILMRKDPASRKYFAQQLAINAEVQKGVRLKDMPAYWFVKEEITDYSNTLQVYARIAYASRCIDELNFEAAYDYLHELMQHAAEIPALFQKEIACELLFLELISNCREEEVDRLYTSDLEKYVQQHKQVMSSKQRLLCTVALYKEKDRRKAEAIYEELFHKRDKYLLQGEVAFDLEIMKHLLEK